MWWNVNCAYSVSSLPARAGSLSLGASPALHTVMLKFPHGPLTKPFLKPQVSPTIHRQYLTWSLWQLARVKYMNRCWGDKKKISAKTPCESEQTNLPWETGLPDLRARPLFSFTAPLQCASAHATGKKTISRCEPQTGAASAFLLAPLGWQPSAVSGPISTGAGGGMLWLLAQGVNVPSGTSPIQGLCFWLRTPKDCSRHRVGAGRQAWGLRSACGLIWDKGEGEEKQRSLVELGLVLVWVTGRWSKQTGTCFILRCEQRQTHDHCCARCWPSLGTQVNFGHLRSRRALTSWRAWGKARELQNPMWCQ